jgi:hypothetical protein
MLRILSKKYEIHQNAGTPSSTNGVVCGVVKARDEKEAKTRLKSGATNLHSVPKVLVFNYHF